MRRVVYHPLDISQYSVRRVVYHPLDISQYSVRRVVYHPLDLLYNTIYSACDVCSHVAIKTTHEAADTVDLNINKRIHIYAAFIIFEYIEHNYALT